MSEQQRWAVELAEKVLDVVWAFAKEHPRMHVETAALALRTAAETLERLTRRAS